MEGNVLPLLLVTTSFLLVRHGETDWNQEGRLQGQNNEAQLTHKGEIQAEDVGRTLFQSLQGRQVELWTSALARTDKTAAIIAKVLNYSEDAIQSDERLQEANHGRLEGMVAEEYERDPSYQKWQKLSSKERFFIAMDDEQGESYDRVALRAKAALKKIAEQNSDAIKIIVTHGGVINALRENLTENYDFPNIKNGEIIVIQWSDHEFSLMSLEELVGEKSLPKSFAQCDCIQ
jgi:broad specificity phosphatase PhoE